MQTQHKLQATSDHVRYCFDSLLAHFAGQSVGVPSFEDLCWSVFQSHTELESKLLITFTFDHGSIRRGFTCSPLFVTWNKESRRGGTRLRGCIGTLEAKDLHQALRDYALTSALGDRRFPHIEQTEVPALTCTVSLLCCFERAAGWLDWTIGQHGLIVEFTDPLDGCKRNATFLPEIAEQEGWSQQHTIDSLISKSGYSGTITPQLRESLGVVRYESTSTSLTYNQYLQLRQDAAMDLAVPA